MRIIRRRADDDAGRNVGAAPGGEVEDLRANDIVIVCSTRGAKPDQVTAISMLANAEMLLQVAAMQNGGGGGQVSVTGGGQPGHAGQHGLRSGSVKLLLCLIAVTAMAAAERSRTARDRDGSFGRGGAGRAGAAARTRRRTPRAHRQ